MEQSSNISTIVLLVILLIISNLKSILLFREWIHFKLTTMFKQYKNERENKTNCRS
jgi:predicted membrane protein